MSSNLNKEYIIPGVRVQSVLSFWLYLGRQTDFHMNLVRTSLYEISHHKQVDDRLVSWVMISGVNLPFCLYLFTSRFEIFIKIYCFGRFGLNEHDDDLYLDFDLTKKTYCFL